MLLAMRAAMVEIEKKLSQQGMTRVDTMMEDSLVVFGILGSELGCCLTTPADVRDIGRRQTAHPSP